MSSSTNDLLKIVTIPIITTVEDKCRCPGQLMICFSDMRLPYCFLLWLVYNCHCYYSKVLAFVTFFNQQHQQLIKTLIDILSIMLRVSFVFSVGVYFEDPCVGYQQPVRCKIKMEKPNPLFFNNHLPFTHKITRSEPKLPLFFSFYLHNKFPSQSDLRIM